MSQHRHDTFYHIQLAFRSCHNLRERKLTEAKRVLCAFDNSNNHNGVSMGETQREASIALENSIKNYLLSTSDVFCLDEIENAVATQVSRTRALEKLYYHIYFLNGEGRNFFIDLYLAIKL